MSSNKSSRIAFISVLLVFAAPVIAAYLILQLGWFKGGATSHGQMVNPPLQRAQWRDPQWQDAWALIGMCRVNCEPMQSYLQRIKVTLGQYQQRVVVLSVGDNAPLHRDRQLFWQASLTDVPEPWQTEGTILIMDPLGQVMLAYPPSSDEQLAEQGRGVKTDLYKMLKLSRVG